MLLIKCLNFSVDKKNDSIVLIVMETPETMQAVQDT